MSANQLAICLIDFGQFEVLYVRMGYIHGRLYKLTSFLDPEKALDQIFLVPRLLGVSQLGQKFVVSPGWVVYSVIVGSLTVWTTWFLCPKLKSKYYVVVLFMIVVLIMMEISVASTSLSSWRNRYSYGVMVSRLREIGSMIGKEQPTFDNLRHLSKQFLSMSLFSGSYLWFLAVFGYKQGLLHCLMVVFYYYTALVHESTVLQQSALLSYSSQRFDLINSQLSSADHDRILILVRIHSRLHSLCRLFQDTYSVPILSIIASDFTIIVSSAYFVLNDSSGIRVPAEYLLFISCFLIWLFLYMSQLWAIVTNYSTTASKVMKFHFCPIVEDKSYLQLLSLRLKAMLYSFQ
jgi:hypothetical protein